MKNKLIYILTIATLILVGYFFVVRGSGNNLSENSQAEQANGQLQEETTSRPVTPEELAELKKDPLAPDWLRNAESCTWVGEQIYCKLKGE